MNRSQTSPTTPGRRSSLPRRRLPSLPPSSSLSLTLAVCAAVLCGLFAATPAEARKPCNCWIGVERGQVLHDYGTIETYRATESGKKRKCAKACAEKCAADIQSNDFLCRAFGGAVSPDDPVIGAIGCFSVVGRKDSPNNTWDYDGRPGSFRGCCKSCSCPRGWWDENRGSCVVGVDCQVPGMPDGDKGGGYFAWDETLFSNVRGGRCVVAPTGSAACSSSGNDDRTWTAWLDRDNPSGVGDYETLRDFQAAGQVCDAPTAIECRAKDGRSWDQTGQVVTCDLGDGLVCRNDDQPGSGRCLDYEVRFLCP